LVRRRVVKTSANGKKRSYSCSHCFSQIIICGDCGEMFRRIHWNNRGCKSIVWRCTSRLEATGLECHARTINEIAEQIFELREKRQQASVDTVQRNEQLSRITDLQDFIKSQTTNLTEFDEALVKRWLKQITVWPDHCTVELKSGLKVDVDR
jgi:restriction endonuclease Mrr